MPCPPTEFVESLESRRLLAVDLSATISSDPSFILGGAGALLRPDVTVTNSGDSSVQMIWSMRFVLTPDQEELSRSRASRHC